MQILHSALSRPQASTGSSPSGTRSPPLLQIRRESLDSSTGLLSTESLPISNQYYVTFSKSPIMNLNPPPSTSTSTLDVYMPNYVRLNSSTPMEIESTDVENRAQDRKPSLVVTTGDNRRNNPNGDESRRPGDHYKDSGQGQGQGQGQPTPNVPRDEDTEENEDDDMYEYNGFKYRHSKHAMLIVNLYGGQRNGYTFTAYVPETMEKPPRTFAESQLFPYSKSELMDCINTETVPIKLCRAMKRLNGIDLMRYRNCVVCEIRDFRRFSASPSALAKIGPAIRQILLRPTTQTLRYDFERLVAQSYTEKTESTRMPSSSADSGRARDVNGAPLPKKKRHEHEKSKLLLDTGPEDELTLDQIHELESRFVKETAGGLCLDPSKQVGIVANCAQFEKFKWNTPELQKTAARWEAKRRKIEAVRKMDLNTEFGEDEAVPAPGAPPLDAYDREFVENTCKTRRDFMPFLRFVQKAIKTHKLKRDPPEQALKLPPVVYRDYPDLAPPTNPEEFVFLTIPAEPCNVRSVNSDNTTRLTQEYNFETERRKRPHRTRLTIYQRNGVESYFGELEQEAFVDFPDQYGSGYSMVPNLGLRGPPPIKPMLLDTSNIVPAGSKCQFELGSSRNVELYVRQFTDIFTEDGRRPCKIVYQKGMSGPHTVATTTYQPLYNNASNNVPTSTNVIISHNGAPPPPHNSSNTIIVSVPALAPPSSLPVSSSSAPSGTPPQSQPPVQIVHPQPRPQPIQIYANGQAGTIVSIAPITTSSSLTGMPTMTQTATGANVNLNLNLNSARLIQQQQRQQLTRPQIYNVNMQAQSQQQRQQQDTVVARSGTGTLQPAPQLIQPQQNLRLKQPTLATLLLAGLQNSNAKPITVAIQPQPHQNQGNLNQIHINNTLDLHQQAQHHQLTHAQVNAVNHHHLSAANSNPIMIMVSPATAQSLGNAQNTITIPSGAGGHHSGSLSLNLNAINLDGLLSVSNSSNNSTNYVTSTAIGTSSANSSQNTLNILRLSNNTSTVTLQPQQLVRQNSASVLSPPQGNIVNVHPGATGILINHHNSGNTGNPNMNSAQAAALGRLQQHPELEEIPVPDLNSLLNSGPTRVATGSFSRSHSNGTSIDLNLNLNVNLSGAAQTTSRSTSTNGSANDHYEVQNGRPNSQNGGVNTNCVDSIFNALSDAIGPDLGQRLDSSMSAGSGIGIVTSSMSPSHSKTASPAITLNDLLGSPPMIPSPALSVNHLGSPPPPQSPISPNIVTSSSIAYSTPRLSALLAGSPSADSSNILVDSSSGRGGNPNYGNLLDRLMAQQPQQTGNQRTGGSRLNPIATATPNVVLEHPMLAATLTQGSNPSLRQALTRPTAYRQIAPAPPPGLQPQQQHQQQQQQQQLINLLGLGLVGATATGSANPGQPGTQTLRINSGNAKPATGASASGGLGGR